MSSRFSLALCLRRLFEEFSRTSKRNPSPPRSQSLVAERLEDRRLLSIFNLVPGVADGDPGSLRTAISSANGNGEDDIINLAAGTYALTRAGAGEDSNATGDLDLIEAGHIVIVRGAGAAVTIIDASALLDDRVFHIKSGVTVVFEHVTITGGNTAAGDGGGIWNGGVLTLTNSSISGNRASQSAGGIRNLGTLTVTDSTISRNIASSFGGGGIANSGTLTLENSRISDNSTAAWHGGGMANSGTLTLGKSTISGNSAYYDGGGIYNTGMLTVDNSTISGNSAPNRMGGGICNYYRGTVVVSNSTITGNRASSYAGGGAGSSATARSR